MNTLNGDNINVSCVRGNASAPPNCTYVIAQQNFSFYEYVNLPIENV
jgi:hypothetical protein